MCESNQEPRFFAECTGVTSTSPTLILLTDTLDSSLLVPITRNSVLSSFNINLSLIIHDRTSAMQFSIASSASASHVLSNGRNEYNWVSAAYECADGRWDFEERFVCCLTWINESTISRWLMSYDFVKLLVFSVCRWPCCNTRKTILSTKKSKLPKKGFLCDNNMISYDQFSIFTATGACSWHVHSIRLFWRHLTPSREAWYLKFLLMLLTFPPIELVIKIPTPKGQKSLSIL